MALCFGIYLGCLVPTRVYIMRTSRGAERVRTPEIHTTDRRGRESDFYFVMSISIKIYGGRTRTEQRATATRPPPQQSFTVL